MKAKIIIAGYIHEKGREKLRQSGVPFDYYPAIKRSSLKAKLQDYVGMVVRSRIEVDQALLQKASSLQFVIRAGSGMDNIDISYAEEQGIVCQNTPEGNREAVGQHGLGLLLALLNHIARADREVKKKVWKRYKNEGVELEGQTIGIIGLGNTGEAFVRKLKGFDVNVIAYDKYRKGTSLEEVQLVKLERIYQESDIVSLHLPLTEETTYWADRPFFEAFKKNITFLNTARGKLVNTKVLVEMLKTEKVKAAALDVLENEKLDKLTPQQQYWFDYLATHPRVILTPHIAGWSKQSREKIAEMVARKAERLWKALS